MARLYIGTYTSPEGSKGIYQADLDTAIGALSEPKLVAEVASPSFLAVHPRGFLYAVLEGTGGEVAAYRIEGDRLTHLNTETSKGGGPCHLSLDNAGRNVLVATYGGGTVACLPIRQDGSLAPASSHFRNEGGGPNKSRQEKPHLHSIYADARDKFVYACDLGTDEVLVFDFDSHAGKLKLADPRAAKCPPGAGPRHLTLQGRFAYVNNEMHCSVTAFELHPTGAMRAFQTISTLPDGETTRGKSTAEIACHPSGRWLYVSNRGHDSIAVYDITGEGSLELVEIKKLGVKEPRGFAIDSSGAYLVVGGQKSHDLESLAIHQVTGKLEAKEGKARVGTPVCVAFWLPG